MLLLWCTLVRRLDVITSVNGIIYDAKMKLDKTNDREIINYLFLRLERLQKDLWNEKNSGRETIGKRTI
jgi:hypothetical protein